MKKICVFLLLTILTAGCGYTRKSNSMSSAPVITALNPNSATSGQAFNLTVNGSNFTSGSVIYWGTTAKMTDFVSSGQLMAAITSTDTACSMTPCMVSVYVLTTGGIYGGGVKSNTMTFTIN
jgi:IPT/TIG domain